MEFPRRTPEHITESESWKVLEQKTPAMWILREVTERDYGIDAYIELVSAKGEVTGASSLFLQTGHPNPTFPYVLGWR